MNKDVGQRECFTRYNKFRVRNKLFGQEKRARGHDIVSTLLAYPSIVYSHTFNSHIANNTSRKYLIIRN